MCRRCLRFDKLNIPVYFELCVTRCSTFSIAGNVERFLGKIILRWDDSSMWRRRKGDQRDSHRCRHVELHQSFVMIKKWRARWGSQVKVEISVFRDEAILGTVLLEQEKCWKGKVNRSKQQRCGVIGLKCQNQREREFRTLWIGTEQLQKFHWKLRSHAFNSKHI
jgi:hypothetical protein